MENIELTLFVNEIFKSISGEVGGFCQGQQCIFVRLAGCNLKCEFCDASGTQKIQPQDKEMTVDYLFKQIEKFKFKSVVITGGEPFYQSNNTMQILVEVLAFWGYHISIETNGTYRVPLEILKRATIVMDYKLNFIEKMALTNFTDLKHTDFVKFVVRDKIMMGFALNAQRLLTEKGCNAHFAYSPMISAGLSPADLMWEYQEKSDMILSMLDRARMEGILNLQIHKIVQQP